MVDVDVTDNTDEVLKLFKKATASGLEIIGGKIETYAKKLVAPRGPKGNAMPNSITAQLRNSIDHHVDGDAVVVGSELDMAAYVELGTSKEYNPPPQWINNQVKPGKNSGLPWWLFYDKKQKRVRVGLPMKPTPFLRPAVEKHVDEYKKIVENELKNA